MVGINPNRAHFECASCHKQTSAICGTMFQRTKVLLLKWFWAIYYISRDKGGISALRLSKLISLSWKTAFHMLRIIRNTMGNRDSIYGLSGTVELDDAYIGGKRGCGADGKTSILVACENHDGYPSNNGVKPHARLEKKVTPPEFVDEWLPWVHVAIANLKRFILGTFHGTSHVYIQEYLNEFCYRFDRRF